MHWSAWNFELAGWLAGSLSTQFIDCKYDERRKKKNNIKPPSTIKIKGKETNLKQSKMKKKIASISMETRLEIEFLFEIGIFFFPHLIYSCAINFVLHFGICKTICKLIKLARCGKTEILCLFCCHIFFSRSLSIYARTDYNDSFLSTQVYFAIKAISNGPYAFSMSYLERYCTLRSLFLFRRVCSFIAFHRICNYCTVLMRWLHSKRFHVDATQSSFQSIQQFHRTNIDRQTHYSCRFLYYIYLLYYITISEYIWK